jgi:diphthamide biosynthesis methyltransferase
MCISIIAATSLLLVEEEQDSAVVTAAAEAIVVERIHGNDDSIEDGSFYDLVDAEVGEMLRPKMKQLHL